MRNRLGWAPRFCFGENQRMRLELDTALVDEAFSLADDIAAPVVSP
jgi:hypothetical protein